MNTNAPEERTSTPSDRSKQYFPTSNQKHQKKSRARAAETPVVTSEASLREKLVANEIECTRQLTDARIKILNAEHQAHLQLISKQTTAAERQTDFWLAAADAMRKFGRTISDEQFQEFSIIIQTASLVESAQQSESVGQSTKTAVNCVDSTHNFYTGSQVTALAIEPTADGAANVQSS